MTVIGISGSYGGLNLGDEAILTCVVEEVRGAIGEVEFVVFSRNPEHTRAHQMVHHAVDVRRLAREAVMREIRRLHLLLLGGGGLLYDGEAEHFLREVQVALELGVPTVTCAIGAGPLETNQTRRLVADVLNRIHAVTVREEPAKRILEQAGVTRSITVTADPALLLTPQPFSEDMLRKEGVEKRRPLVGMSVREPGPAAPDLRAVDYHTLLANAADFIADRLDADIVFVPMERGDIRDSHAVIGRMAEAERASVLKGDYSPREILGLMEHLDMAVGMRLHFLIFAALARVPFVPLPYAAKVEGFLEELELPVRILREQHAGPLLASIDRLWDHRAKLRQTLDRRVPELQARARRTIAIARDALGADPATERLSRRRSA